MPKYKLLFLDVPPQTLPCKGFGMGQPKIPPRDREAQFQKLHLGFEKAWSDNETATESRTVQSLPGKGGVYLQVKGASGFDLITKSLDSAKGKHSLLNVRDVEVDGRTTRYATLFIPDKERSGFAQKLFDYRDKLTKGDKPKNAPLIESIENIALATLEDFWTDDPERSPENEPIWCEVWLRDDGTHEAISRFKEIAQTLDIPNRDGTLDFPERAVVLAKLNKATSQQLLLHSPDVAEYRLSRETAEFFMAMPPHEQAQWSEAFLRNAVFQEDAEVSVCLLDTGVNNGHPLISPLLHDNDLHAADSTWGVHDHEGHGTGMAGIAAYGDLAQALASSATIEVPHCLESSKLLPPTGENPPELYGFLTAKCLSLAEDAVPDRKRQVCMAVTAPAFYHYGEPTSWSASVDALASGANDDRQRLIIVSAGNMPSDELAQYPASNLTQSVQDPAQAWNALTVGAYTLLDTPGPDLAGYVPIAQSGQLSPHSTTSAMWDKKWPIKPEVVFEGGNAAKDAQGNCDWDASLSLLTTHYQHQTRHFDSFNATSAATAQAAWFAAQVQSTYPDAWPETIRALMVHSAQWTPAMLQQFAPNGSKTELAKLCRICGYGVPSLERAKYCMNNSLVLVAQNQIQPYTKGGMQMHLFDLPWPKEALLDLGGQKVTLRVTLSYFIEPGPGKRGWADKYRYASHGLRFEVQGAQESTASFITRVGKDSEEKTERPSSRDLSGRWGIGVNGRSSGSLSSDLWETTAAEIAACNSLAVYPVIGWWRQRTHLKKYESPARYSLVVSLHTEAQEVDIYTPVKILIDNAVKTPTLIEVKK
jgi:hypothetical protein